MQRLTVAVLALVAMVMGWPLRGGAVESGLGRPGVRVERTPGQGVQPQMAVGGDGTVHLVYLAGPSRNSDVWYRRRRSLQAAWSEPLRVNSDPGSAVAVGTIRGPHLALGRNGRVHVVWNGVVGTGGGHGEGPLLYSRLNDEGSAFEKQRDLKGATFDMDGGASIAADGSGRVTLVWHAASAPRAKEEERRVWLARSTDDGKTFAPEKAAWSEPTGACGCCALRAATDERGRISVLYRAARNTTDRGMYWLGGAAGKSLAGKRLDHWNVGTCPLSSEAMAVGPAGIIGAWENNGQIYWTKLDPAGGEAGSPTAAPGTGRGRKHPAVAVGRTGTMLLAWTEGTAWQRGGSLAWQAYDAAGKATSVRGSLDEGIPVWGSPAAAALPDGSFLLLH